MNGLFILLIIIIILIVIFLAVYPFIVFKPVKTSLPQELNPVPLYYSCKSGFPCVSGAICDSSILQCKRADGQPCNNGEECLTTSYCSGLCVSGPNGDVNQPC